MGDQQEGPRFRAVVSAEWTVRGTITDAAYSEVLDQARTYAQQQSGTAAPPIEIEGTAQGIVVAVRVRNDVFEHLPKVTANPPSTTRGGGAVHPRGDVETGPNRTRDA